MRISTTGSTHGRISERAAAGIERLCTTAHSATDRVAESALSAAEQLERKKDEWIAVQDHWVAAARECVRRHPIASVGIAVGIGLLLSRLTTWNDD